MSTTGKSIDNYERLANALEALPGGFARTESGVEMELLKMAFSPEEALVACHMTRTPETPAQIAKRVGLPVDDITALLKRLIPRRMVRVATKAMVASAQELEGDDVSTGWDISWLAGTKAMNGCWARSMTSSSSDMWSRVEVTGSFRRGRAARVLFLTGARSSPSGWRGSPTLISTLTGNGMSVS